MRSIPADIVFAKLDKKFTRKGVLLKGLRAREGFSQIEFAKKIKVSQTMLSKMENGLRPIEDEIVKKIKKIFGVNIDR